MNQSITDIRIAQLNEVVEYFKKLLNNPTEVYQNPKEYHNELYNMGFHIQKAISLIKSYQANERANLICIKELRAENKALREDKIEHIIAEERKKIIEEIISTLEDMK